MPSKRALQAFESAGAWSAPIRCEPVASGLIHETFRITDARNHAFVLQRVNPAFAREIHENIRRVTEHLARRDVTTFEVVNCDGRPDLDLGNEGLWRLLTCIPGVSTERPASPAHAAEAGRAAAQFHRALFDFDEPLAPIGFPFHDTRRHFEDLATALRVHRTHALHADVARLAKEIFAAADRLELFDELPPRVIHGDLKFNNLLFDATSPADAPRAIGWIDLDTVARLPLAYDWGDAMRSWCNLRPEEDPEAELDTDLVRAAILGLKTAFDEPPRAAEAASLARGLEVVSLELCARFATDALEEKHWRWDAQRYERAGEHHCDRARGQYALHLQARATREERLREIVA